MRLLNKLIASTKKRYFMLTNGGYSVGSAYGCNFLLDWRHPLDKKLSVGLFEHDIILDMIGLLKQHKPDVFLDIGSHSGLYAIIAKKNLPDCDVHCFEPDPENLCQLRGNLFLNRFYDSIRVHDYGLSDHSGEAFLDRTENTGRGTRVISPDGDRKIKIMRLDDVLSLADKSVFIKVDVEGHEGFVIDGALQILRTNKCLIQVEIFSDNLPHISNKLINIGYRLLFVHNNLDYYYTNI